MSENCKHYEQSKHLIFPTSKVIYLRYQPSKLHYETINIIPPPSPPPMQTTYASIATPHHSPPTLTGTYQKLTPLGTTTTQTIIYKLNKKKLNQFLNDILGNANGTTTTILKTSIYICMDYKCI